MLIRIISAGLLCGAALLAQTNTNTITIPSTGTGGATTDPNWTITGNVIVEEPARGPAAIVTKLGSGWAAPAAGAGWIAPAADQSSATRSASCCKGYVNYQVQFNVADPATASATLTIGGSDVITAWLNTMDDAHIVYSTEGPTFAAPPTITLKQGGAAIGVPPEFNNVVKFQPGPNTLIVQVLNYAGGPTGLYVFSAGTAPPAKPGCTAPATGFFDATFNAGEWELVPVSLGSGGQTSAAQISGDGNPPPAREVDITMNPGSPNNPGTVFAFHGKTSATYDPRARGTLVTIDYCEDNKPLAQGSVAQLTGPALKQGGNIYVAANVLSTNSGTTWANTTGSGYRASNFVLLNGPNGIDGTKHPDFSSAGGVMEFGFFRGHWQNTAGGFTSRVGIDNWAVTVHPVTSVTCTMTPRNIFLALHRPEHHVNEPDHRPHAVRVTVLGDGVPLAAQPVTVTASLPAFPAAPNALPTLTTVSGNTDDTGIASFIVSPPAPSAFDRTDLVASGTVNGLTFRCTSAVLTGVGTLSGAIGQTLPNQTVAITSPSNFEDRLLYLRNLLDDSPALRARARRLVRRSLLAKTLSAAANEFTQDEARKVDELASRLVPSRFRGDRPQAAPHPLPSRVQPDYGKLSLAFEANRGQMNPEVSFLARSAGYRLYLATSEAILVQDPLAYRPAKPAAIHMRFAGANPHPRISGESRTSQATNYLLGPDPSHWRLGVPNFERVRYAAVYPGIDLVFHGSQREMEFDFVLAPGARLERIGLAFGGAGAVDLDPAGGCIVRAPGGDLTLRKPVAYQERNGSRQIVPGRYVARPGNQIGFEVDGYDPSLPLVIDPVIGYGTFLGGSGEDAAMAIAVDAQGSAYVTGSTTSADFPTTPGAQASAHGGPDIFVTKLSPDGSSIVYSTYIGGSASDAALGIAVDSSGSAYVTGTTSSSDFPLMLAQQPALAGNSDMFAFKLTPDGSGLVYSTYIGGSGVDVARGIALDSSGNAYLTGFTSSPDFPVQNALQASNNGGDSHGFDAVVLSLSADGGSLRFSTFLGGSADDQAYAIAVDASGSAYVTGQTRSKDFPLFNPLQKLNRGAWNCFVTKLDPAGQSLVFSTFLGGSSYDAGMGIALDASNNVYVAGATGSADFPVLNAAQAKPAAADLLGADAFVTQISADGSALVYSTFLGGKGTDVASSIAVGADGNAFVGGETDSIDFPGVGGPQATAGKDDGFVVKLSPAGALSYAVLLGGAANDSVAAVALDPAGNLYAAGSTQSTALPASGGFQGSSAGGTDAMVLKLTSDSAAPARSARR